MFHDKTIPNIITACRLNSLLLSACNWKTLLSKFSKLLLGISFSLNQFLPRDAMHKCGLCHHAVSVCLSVTFVDHVKMNKRIFKFFSSSGSQAILVIPYQTSWHYSDGNPLTGAQNARGHKIMTIFDQYHAFISEMRQDRAIVTMEGE